MIRGLHVTKEKRTQNKLDYCTAYESFYCHFQYWFGKLNLAHQHKRIISNLMELPSIEAVNHSQAIEFKPMAYSQYNSVKISRNEICSLYICRYYIQTKSNKKGKRIWRSSTRLFSATKASIFCWFSSSGRSRSESSILATFQKEQELFMKL